VKKSLFVLLALLAILLILRFVVGGPEDDWVCVENQWVKHGNPVVAMPKESCK